MDLGNYIGIIATLIGACAVFITITPLVNSAHRRKMEKKIQKIESDIDEMKKELSKKADAYLEIEPKEIILDADGKPCKINVKSNTVWTVK